MNLEKRSQALFRLLMENELPGKLALYQKRPDIEEYTEKQESKILTAVKAEDPFLFDKYEGNLLRAYRRINEILALEYFEENRDTPDQWELRYMKWMPPGYMKFGSELGDFYIAMGRGKRGEVPEDAPCYEPDEVLLWLDPAVELVMKAFDAMPLPVAKVKDIPRPAKGEYSIHFYAEPEGFRYEIDWGPETLIGQRKGLRIRSNKVHKSSV